MKIQTFPMSLFGINTYILWDPESLKAAIIDPAMINGAERDRVRDFIAKNKLTVTNVINTHLHIDHCIGNNWVTDTYGVKTSAHIGDSGLGENIGNQARMFGLPFEVKGVVIDTPLNDGDTIKIGNGELKVIHVPGHSQGGLALYDATDGILISGDSLFRESIGRTDLPGGNSRQLLDSIKNKLFTLPDNTTVYPGHGPTTTIGYEKTHNPFF